MKIHRLEEFFINQQQHQQIGELLQQCFSSYPKHRSFYKQVPNFRFLVFEKNNLIGHLAIIHRLIKVGQENFTIFGVSDLCVHPNYQQKNIASILLKDLEILGKDNNIDFILLIAQDQKFYLKNNYKSFNNNCRWLIINELESLGLTQRSLDSALMIKPLNQKKWNDGMVDFMGSLF